MKVIYVCFFFSSMFLFSSLYGEEYASNVFSGAIFIGLAFLTSLYFSFRREPSDYLTPVSGLLVLSLVTFGYPLNVLNVEYLLHFTEGEYSIYPYPFLNTGYFLLFLAISSPYVLVGFLGKSLSAEEKLKSVIEIILFSMIGFIVIFFYLDYFHQISVDNYFKILDIFIDDALDFINKRYIEEGTWL